MENSLNNWKSEGTRYLLIKFVWNILSNIMSFWVSTWHYSTNTCIFNWVHAQANVKVKLDIKKLFTSLSTGIFHVKEQLHAQPLSLKLSSWISSCKKLPQWCIWYFKWIKVSQSSILRRYLMQFSTLVHIRQDILNAAPIQMLTLFQTFWIAIDITIISLIKSDPSHPGPWQIHLYRGHWRTHVCSPFLSCCWHWGHYNR